VRNKLVEFLLSDKLLQEEEESEPFLVWNRGKCVIWILSLKSRHQFGEFMVLAISLHGISEGLPTNDGGKMAILFAMAAS
jgi:hypothetical protein